jgi:hypothetical protein
LRFPWVLSDQLIRDAYVYGTLSLQCNYGFFRFCFVEVEFRFVDFCVRSDTCVKRLEILLWSHAYWVYYGGL